MANTDLRQGIILTDIHGHLFLIGPFGSPFTANHALSHRDPRQDPFTLNWADAPFAKQVLEDIVRL